MTNSLVDLAVADLHKGGHRIASAIPHTATKGGTFNGKTRKRIAKHASSALRVSLRSAHRFSVTEEMRVFCRDMAFRLSTNELDALVENATPPFESAFFENIPAEGWGVLVERERWSPTDWFFPSIKSSDGPEFHRYDNSVAFAKWSTSPQKKREEAVLAEHALPNSKDHPVYFVQIISKAPGETTAPGNFGFYFCPSGFLWKPWPKSITASEEFKIENVLLRTSLPLGAIYVSAPPPQFDDTSEFETYRENLQDEIYSLPTATRKVAFSTTAFFPLYVGLEHVVEPPKPLTDLTDGGADWANRLVAQRQGVDLSESINYVKYQMLEWVRYNLGLQILCLLSTLNFDWVVDGTEPGKTGKRVRVEPDAPFNSHSEIQINLPKEKGVELALKKFHRASPLGVRRHWVRAHNRVIRKNGVPVRVIRVSEHQRGDAKLGTVTHDYVLERDHKVKA